MRPVVARRATFLWRQPVLVIARWRRGKNHRTSSGFRARRRANGRGWQPRAFGRAERLFQGTGDGIRNRGFLVFSPLADFRDKHRVAQKDRTETPTRQSGGRTGIGTLGGSSCRRYEEKRCAESGVSVRCTRAPSREVRGGGLDFGSKRHSPSKGSGERAEATRRQKQLPRRLGSRSTPQKRAENRRRPRNSDGRGPIPLSSNRQAVEADRCGVNRKSLDVPVPGNRKDGAENRGEYELLQDTFIGRSSRIPMFVVTESESSRSRSGRPPTKRTCDAVEG